jgi:hypothetical protein
MSRRLGRFCSASQDRRLPLPRQILEGACVEQRLVELSTLKLAQLGQGG